MSLHVYRCSQISIRFALATLVAAGLALAALPAVSQTVTVIKTFSQNGGIVYPLILPPTQGRDGLLYGEDFGMPNNSIFRLNLAAKGTLLYTYSDLNAQHIFSGVMLARDGAFYGVDPFGGPGRTGALFRLTRSGQYTELHVFQGGSDGSDPVSRPIQADNGILYGTTHSTLYSYSSGDGYKLLASVDPQAGSNIYNVLQGADGNLYVVAIGGGTSSCGAILKFNVSGTLLSSTSFNCKEQGVNPIWLVLANDSNIYGTAAAGGNSDGRASGTIFRVNTDGTLTIMHTFQGGKTDGAEPNVLTLGSDGMLYGGTVAGGTLNAGALYRISTDGVFTLLYSDRPSDALQSQGVVQDTNGKFYGFSTNGGSGYGTFYSLDVGLGPFTTLQKYQGKVGNSVDILGQGFTGTKSVSFNGVAASSFSVVSDTYMTAVVPSGATTGNVTVTTPTGTLTSNKVFKVNQ